MSSKRARRVGVGIDFGTSNSVAAVFDGDEVALAPLEAHHAVSSAAAEHDAEIMPSATYIDRDLQTLTGQDAIDRYIDDNTGRKVELVPEVIGKAMLAVGVAGAGSRNPGETLTMDVYGDAMTDTGMRGRLFRGTKRLLGKADVRRLMVFDHPFRLVALVTPILLRMCKALSAEAGELDHGCVGHPVNFEGRDEHRNQLALSRLGEAYRYAGIEKPRFYPEPIAAAVSFLHANPDAVGDHLLTVDFGGGTLDFCILERTPGNRFRVVDTHGIGLGGDHIDQRLFRELLFPLLGKGERWRRRGEYGVIDTSFPFDEYEEFLVNWPVTYLLNQNRYTTAVQDCIDHGGPGRIKFRRLRELIEQNLGYVVFQAIKDFKAILSHVDEAVLDIPEIDVDVRLSRHRFEAMIADMLGLVEQGIEATLARASLPRSAIDIVLRTGGSSLIPAVHRLLDGFFPGRVVDHDPFTSVAAGLAIADYHQLPAAP
ncbi:MAG: Hsp70 family protein [Gammaproteobacteria bacterium]|nr:Hsp70 family protein [Gammaproteobacteria bacterium]